MSLLKVQDDFILKLKNNNSYRKVYEHFKFYLNEIVCASKKFKMFTNFL